MTLGKYLKVATVAKRLDCRTETILRAIRRGLIPAVKTPGGYLIREADLVRYVRPVDAPR